MAWQSVMVDHPDHVYAIGMLSIEHSNVETMCAILLGHVLDVDPKVGEAIYWRPQSSGVRFNILEAAIETTYAPIFENPDLPVEFEANAEMKTLLGVGMKLVQRASNVSKRRNSVMHDIWGYDEKAGMVSKAEAKSRHTHKTVHINQLRDMIQEMRGIIDAARQFERTLFDRKIRRLMAYAKPMPDQR